MLKRFVRCCLILGLVGAFAAGQLGSANAETKTTVQFAVKTTAGPVGAPVRTADFSSADRENVNVQPVWYGRGYYGGGFGRGYYGVGYGRGYYGGWNGFRGYGYGYRPYYANYRPYYVNRPYYAYRPYYGYGANLYSSYYPPYYNYTYFRAPYYASPPVYFGYPQTVYYAPSFATYGNAYYW